MYAIIGLGNPTKKYDGTRHNIGFEIIDQIAKDYQIDVNQLKHKGLCGQGYIDGVKVLLVKPLTYMNLSGECVRAVCDFYKIPLEEIIIIYDDISLDVGQMRIRTKGSAGGHNGIKSIIQHLDTMVFNRIKVGVGQKPPGWDLADYVLSKHKNEDQAAISEVKELSSKAVHMIIHKGINDAMNEYNRSKKQ